MKKIYQLILGMLAVVLIAACADDKDFAEFTKLSQSGTTVTVAASMPGDKSVSKIGLVQSDNSLNIISQWQSADEVQIFVSQNGNSYAIGKSPVQNISDDGKCCSFSFDLPSEISADAPYSVYGFCGIDGKLENGTITIDAAAKRIPLEKMKAPCYFVAQPTSANFEAKFNHIGTYEILHVANKSTSEITFTHNGYTTSAPWYYNALHGSLSCSSSTGTLTNTGADGEPVSEAATIPAGTTASIVSWYLPTGGALSEAILNASINGNAVKSSDTKSSTISIQSGKAYHLYATWDGTELRFLPKDNPYNPPVSDREYVDLGLPSGTLWATCNVGAENPWDYGDYFAWGETTPKDDYSTYKYANGRSDIVTKYCSISDYGNDGFTDNLTILLPEDDAATANWGCDWRMPTQAEFQELYDNCDCERRRDYNGTGVSGLVVKSRNNSHSIFLPASGFRRDDRICWYRSNGFYWSSSLDADMPSCGLMFDFDYGPSGFNSRCDGQSVRAVRCMLSDNPVVTPSSVSNITIERKYLIHWNNNHCTPDFKIIFDNEIYGVRIGYDNDQYVGASGLILYATNDVDKIFEEELYGQWNMGSVLTDEWVDEKIVFTSDGNITYYQNGSLLTTVSVSVLGIKDAKSIRFDFNPYGWWTGNYHYMDDLKVTVNGKLVIDDTFDYFDYNVWKEPVNPDGVRTEDGIMRMEQNSTDQDYHLRSKPISLVGY